MSGRSTPSTTDSTTSSSESDPHQRMYRLVTVNTSTDRARKLVGEVIEQVRETYPYHIMHCANAKSIDEVGPLVSMYQPDLLFCASMWSADQSEEIKRLSREIVPELRCYAVPQGLRVNDGPDAVVKHVVGQMGDIIEGELGLV